MSTPTTNNASPSPTIQSAPGWTWTVLGVICLLLLIVGGANSCHRKREARKAEEAREAVVATTSPAPTPIYKIGKEPTTHRFESNGCVEIWLEGDWTSYPQPLDAEIKFFNSKGEKVLEQGATRRGSSLPPDSYRICRNSSGATGVQIWQ